jgi:hypothetical protein
MADPGNGGEIIIKGGSVEVEYDGNTYVQDPTNPRKHQNPNKKITKVVITDLTNPARPVVVYDSGDNPGGLKWEIRTTCK